MVDSVILGDLTLYEALQRAGKDPSTVFLVNEALEVCVPLQAPPPAPGNKIL